MRSFNVLLCLNCLFVVCATISSASVVTIFGSSPTAFEFRDPKNGESFLATASFSDGENHVSNFGTLVVQTSNKSNSVGDNTKMFAAGFSEGILTSERIFQYFQNMKCQVDCSGNAPVEVELYFQLNDVWAREQVKAHPDCSFWQFIDGLHHQLDGLMAGYKSSEFGQKNPLQPWAFNMINAMGDLFDILPATSKSRRPNFKAMTYKQAQDYLIKHGHCSALIRITDDLSDAFVGHSSWFTYSAMIRIFKTYKFDLHNAAQHSAIMSFSSYPGSLSSLDDFYLMAGSKLMMTQTTNSIFNASLWDLVVPQSLLAWQRVRAANHLADSGPEWHDYVSRWNSGTYNNQYMVLDAKLFKAGNALQPNTLYVVEQIPGLVVGKDVTDELERGYWSSYNVPYHKEIYVQSGYPDVDAKGGLFVYSQYQQAPRAQIFRRDQAQVHDLASLQVLMRSNNYQTDKFSGGSPWGAICARGDLSSPGYAGGGYDTKVSSLNACFGNSSATVLTANIVNGPTAQGQTAFSWAAAELQGMHDSHVGMPDVFDFEFETVTVAV